VKKTFEESGIDTRRMSIDEFSAFVSKQVTDWAPTVKASGAKLN
jgi:tripartite-type tricarboxylate transporter receptor subunit TctC